MAGNTSWMPPPDFSLDWTSNCTLAAQFLASPDILYKNAFTSTVISYLNSTIPKTWTDYPATSDLVNWYISLTTHDTGNLTHYLSPVYTSCNYEYCKQLDWQGSADVDGQGMTITVLIEASLTSVYLLVLALDILYPSLSHQCSGGGHLRPLIRAFKASSVSFLDATLLFSISMLIANVYSNTTAKVDPASSFTSYELVSSTYMAIFAVFPPLAVYSIVSPQRRPRLYAGAWILISCLASTSFGLGIGNWQPSRDYGPDAAWEMYCAPQRNIALGRFVLCILAATMVAFWLIFIRNVLDVGYLERPGWLLGTLRRHWWCLSAFSSFSTMWAFIGMAGSFKQQVKQNSGDSNEDTHWGFGQILALTTWAPVVVELVYVGVFGPEEGLSARFPQEYKAVKTTPKDDE